MIDLPGVGAPDVARAIWTVFPVDGEEPVTLMRAPGTDLNGVQCDLVAALGGPLVNVDLADRSEFYAAAARAQVIVVTGELRAYGNVLLTKGAVPAPADLRPPSMPLANPSAVDS